MKPILLLVWLCVLTCMAQGQGISLDTTFGNKGYVTKVPDGRNDYLNETACSAIELPDGKLLVLIQTDHASYFVRFLSNGTIDDSYATAGVSDPFPVSDGKLLRTKDGQIYVAGTRASKESDFVVLRLANNGHIDQQFGTAGLLVIHSLERQAQVTGFIAQDDGKLLLAGVDAREYFEGGGRIFRILPNGTLDPTYADGGILTIKLDGLKCLWAIAFSGKNIVVGTTTLYLNYYLSQTILAFDEEGKQVEDFGTGGRIDIPIVGPQNDMRLAVQSNGRILYATNVFNYQTFHYFPRIYGYLPNGQVDESFHGNGITEIDASNQGQIINLLTLDENDHIYLAGNLTASDPQLFFTRFDKNGNIDGSYGDNGWATFGTSYNQEAMYGGLLTSEGAVLALGQTRELPSKNYLVAKMTSSGKPDDDFGNAGYVDGFFPASISQFSLLRALPNGKVVSRVMQRGYYTIAGTLSKYLANGTPDFSAGYEGNFYVDGYYYDLLPNGGLLTLGATFNYAEGTSVLNVRRYDSTGQSDPNYGINGVTQIPFTDFLYVRNILALPDSSALVLGVIYGNTGADQWLLAKVNPAGELDFKFGQEGVIWIDKEQFKQADHVIIQNDGKILVSGHIYIGSPANSSLFIHRFNKDGSPDLQFGENGIAWLRGVTSFEGISALPLSNGKIVLKAVVRPATGADKTMVYGFNYDGTPSPEIGIKEIPFSITIPLIELPNGDVLGAGQVSTATITSGLLYQFRPGGDAASDHVEYINPEGQGGTFTEMVANKEAVWLTGTKFTGFDEIGFIARFNYNNKPTLGIASLTLVNAFKENDIKELKEGDRINMADVGRILNIRANTNPAQVGSVVFSLTGAENHQQTENILPYALFGDQNGNYRNDWKPQPGAYTLTATPYSEARGKGTPGVPISINFTLIDSLTLSHFVLVDAQKNKDIQSFAAGTTQTIDLSRYPHLNLRVTTDAGITESVRFVVNGRTARVENAKPFALASDNHGNYFDWKVAPGTYTITAIPYAYHNATGKEGTPITITLILVNSAPFAVNSIRIDKSAEPIEKERKLSLSVYPNPLANNGTIRFSTSVDTYGTVRLLTTNGNVLRQEFSGSLAAGVEHTLRVDVSNLPKGVYFWQLYTSDGEAATVKMIH